MLVSAPTTTFLGERAVEAFWAAFFFFLSWPELYDKVILLSLTSEDAKFEVEGMKMMLLLNIAILDLKMK